MVLRQGDFPLRELCDPTNPEEAFLWMFVALPMVKGAPLIMPIEYWRQVSKRMWDLGARPVAEPTLAWVAPTASDPNWLTSPGRWVPIDDAPIASEEDKAMAAVEKMGYQQRVELHAALSGGEPYPDSPAGVVARMLSPAQRDVVLTVLDART